MKNTQYKEILENLKQYCITAKDLHSKDTALKTTENGSWYAIKTYKEDGLEWETIITDSKAVDAMIDYYVFEEDVKESTRK